MEHNQSGGQTGGEMSAASWSDVTLESAVDSWCGECQAMAARRTRCWLQNPCKLSHPLCANQPWQLSNLRVSRQQIQVATDQLLQLLCNVCRQRSRPNSSFFTSRKTCSKNNEGRFRGPVINSKRAYCSQVSTAAAPCSDFQAFNILWLPPLVSITSPVLGFL